MEEVNNNRFEKINTFWPSIDQQYSNSQQHQNQNQNQNHVYGHLIDLYKAKQRFKQFIEEIGQLKKMPIRQDVLMYLETQGKKQKSIQVHYKSQTILKKIEIRIQKMIKTKRIKRNWGQEDIKILLWLISKYSDWKGYSNVQNQLNQEDWKYIATLIPGAMSQACMFKWLSLKKTTLSTNSWNNDESNLLRSIVKERDNKGFKHNSQILDWKEISQQLYLSNNDKDKVYRNAKQCRQHWSCYLSPILRKGPWQLHEDVRLLKFIQANNGLKNGRTQNALKNRYTLIVEKQKKESKVKNKNQFELINQYLEKCQIEQYTSQNHEIHGTFFNEQQPNIQQNYELKRCIQRNIVIKEQYPTEQVLDEIFQVPQISSLGHQQIETYNSNDYLSINLSETKVIVPIRVKMFRFEDFAKKGMGQFLKQIQPGVIDATGKFQKVDTIKNGILRFSQMTLQN